MLYLAHEARASPEKRRRQHMVTKRMENMAARGEKLASKLLGLKPTTKLAPFDVVDFGEGYAYEVKTVTSLALSGSNKIHISASAWKRKQEFLSMYGLQGELLVVVVYSRERVEVYRVPLKQHLRISTVIKTGTLIS